MEADRRYGASDTMAPASRVDESRIEQSARAEEARKRFSDGKIAMVSDVAHTAAIDAARIAFAKAKNEHVKEFASTMLADHGKAKQEETNLLLELRMAPEASELSTNLGIESGQTLRAMREIGNGSVDRTYIESQLASHEKFLRVLDEQLIPNANDSRLKGLLQNFRARVLVHVEEAREIQRELAAEDESNESMPAMPAVPSVP